MITPDSVVSLPPKVRLRADRVGGTTVLLAPERGLALNDTAASVLRALDGVRSVREIAVLLAARYDAPAALIEAEAIALLTALAHRALVRVAP